MSEPTEFLQDALAHQTISEFAGHSGFVMVGPSGAGKSTTIAVLMGADFCSTNGKLVCVRKLTAGPKMSNSWASQTTHASRWVINGGAKDFCVFDMAGLFENRGHDISVFTKSNLTYLMRTAGSISGLIVVVECSAWTYGRGQGVRDLAKELMTYIAAAPDEGEEDAKGDNAFVFERMVMVVTHTAEPPANISDLARGFLNSEQEKLQNKLQDYKNRCPLSEADDGAYSGRMREEGIDWKKLEKSEVKEVEELKTAIRLAERFAEGPVVTSNLATPAICKQFREDFHKAVDRIVPFTPKEQRRLCADCNAVDLEFQRQLASAAGYFTVRVGKQVTTLSTLLEGIQKNETVLAAIRDDIDRARSALIKKKNDEIREAEKGVTKAEDEAATLEASTKLVVSRSESPDDYFFFYKLAFKEGRVINRPDDDAHIRGVLAHSIFGPDPNGGSDPVKGGKVELLSDGDAYVRSYFAACRLDILIHEKDYKAVRDRVRSLKEDVEEKKKWLEKQPDVLLNLRAADAARLERYVLEGKKENEQQLEALQESLRKRIPKCNTCQEQTIHGLAACISFIKSKNMLLSDLTSVEERHLSDFLAKYREWRALAADPLLQTYVSNADKVLARMHRPTSQEVDHLVVYDTIPSAVAAQCREHVGTIQTFVATHAVPWVMDVVHEHPLQFAVAGASAVVGNYLQLDFEWILVLVFSCLCFVAAWVRTKNQVLEKAARAVSRVEGEALHEVAETRHVAANIVTEVARIVMRKMKVDLDTSQWLGGVTSDVKVSLL